MGSKNFFPHKTKNSNLISEMLHPDSCLNREHYRSNRRQWRTMFTRVEYSHGTDDLSSQSPNSTQGPTPKGSGQELIL